MKIYTKTGDDGTTMLFGGGRVPKHHLRIEAYGTVDELNSYIGLVRDQAISEHHRQILKQIQDALFTIGANLATNPEKNKVKTPDITEEDIALLEREMDAMDEVLPALKNFILPGGHTTVSFCHLARCVCRRSERLCVALAEQSPVAAILVQYLNRLSDYLFVLARKIGAELGAEEIVWK
ncbi:MAG: cob(I)yrinic acid a,c-diamide adenosyltransferase [Chitinophagales bacterium]